MPQIQRRSTPRVQDGEVRKKNNWRLTPNCYHAPDPRTILVDRQRPGEGYRHVLNKSDIVRFLEILPDWKELAVGLNAIILAPGEDDGWDGFHYPGVVAVCAWEECLWREVGAKYYKGHEEIFNRLCIPCEPAGNGYMLCKFDEAAVRAYLLLHILLHELGHPHDRMTTQRQRRSSRGERYAEDYAFRYEAQIWDAYHRAFRG